MTGMRNATEDELARILDWAAAEGWNPGLDDAAAFFAADPDGFFLAEVGGAPVAAISVVNHDGQYAFLGLYIVLPDYRGKGIGLALWRHALAHAGARTVGLDGVPAQQANYAVSGFRHAGGTTRFAGRVVPEASQRVRSATPGDIERLIDAEATASGYRKPAYLAAWFSDTAHRRTLILDTQDGDVAFCTVRACRSGAKVGPLVARTPAEAETLVRHAATIFDGEIVLDVPDAASGLETLCRSLGLDAGFQTARMYRGAYRAGTPACFAVTSLELG